MTDLVVTN